MSVSANNIRNLAVVGHSGEGKSTLCEAILLNGGSIERMGKTDLGTTVSDFDEQELARKISVSLSVTHDVAGHETQSVGRPRILRLRRRV